MSEINYENMITENLLSYPITSFIKEAGRKDGIDVDHIKTKLLAGGSSLFMASFVGSILGGPLGFIMGLMGYAIGTSAGPKKEKSDYNYVLQSAIRAGQRMVSDIPDELVDEIGLALRHASEDFNESGKTPKQLVEKAYAVIYEVDPRSANLWIKYLDDELQ